MSPRFGEDSPLRASRSRRRRVTQRACQKACKRVTKAGTQSSTSSADEPGGSPRRRFAAARACWSNFGLVTLGPFRDQLSLAPRAQLHVAERQVGEEDEEGNLERNDQRLDAGVEEPGRAGQKELADRVEPERHRHERSGPADVSP